MPQESLHLDLPPRQSLRITIFLPLLVLRYPPAVDQDCGSPVRPVQGRDDHEPIFAIVDPWAKEHLTRVPESAGGEDTAKVEGGEGGGVDLGGEREWSKNESVLVPRD